MNNESWIKILAENELDRANDVILMMILYI